MRESVPILHGLIPRVGFDIVKLRQEGILFCNQNIMKYDMIVKSNDMLAEFVADECTKYGLVKK